MFDDILLIKGVSGIVLALASLGLALWPLTYRVPRSVFNWGAFLLLASSRFACFVGAYIILKQPAQSDLLCYYDWSRSILEGATLYTDEPGIPSCYAPLFHYILAAPLMIVDRHETVVLTAILFELAAFSIWLAIGRRMFDETVARRAAALYVINPLAIWCVAISGQNQSWVALLLGLSVWFLIDNRQAVSGAMLGLSTAAVKWLAALYAPALFIVSPRPIRWTLGFIAVNALVYGGFALAGVDVLYAARIISAEISSGNLPFLATALGYDGLAPGFQRWMSLAGVGILGALSIVLLYASWTRSRRDPRIVIALITMLQVAFMLVSKKSHTTYLQMAFVPLCLIVAMSRPRLASLIIFALFCAIGTVEQSYWYREMRQLDLAVLLSPQRPGEITVTALALFLTMQAAVIAFYLWAFAMSWRQAFGPKVVA